jgi:hypothetical protein
MKTNVQPSGSQLTDLSVPLYSISYGVIQQCTCLWCGKPVPESTLFCSEICRNEKAQQAQLNGGF